MFLASTSIKIKKRDRIIFNHFYNFALLTSGFRLQQNDCKHLLLALLIIVLN
jgi:hypothetical protein